MAGFFGPKVFGAPPTSEATLKTKYNEWEQSMRQLETLLTGKAFLTGNQVTVADIPIYCELITDLKLLNLSAASYPNVNSWILRIEKIPAVQKVS